MKLQYTITIWILAILLFVGIAGIAAVRYFQSKYAVAQFEESALTLAVALEHSLENYMLDVRREHIQDAVALITSEKTIDNVAIISRYNEVYASGQEIEIGTHIRDADIIRALATGETITRTTKHHQHGEISVILPVTNKDECHTCHGSDAAILGVIEVRLDGAPLEAQIRDQTIAMIAIGGIVALVIVGTLGLMLRSTVIRPLVVLASAARRIARGDYGARVQIQKKDEVGLVARTFDEMAERIQQHTLSLEDSNRILEERVQERTKELQQMAAIRGELLERLVSAQEEERRRVAHDLHDETGQTLSVITMDLASVISMLPADANEAKTMLSQTRSLARQSLAELRKLIRDLRPEVLEQLGLESALRSYARSHLESGNIQTEITFVGTQSRLSPQVETTLFRVIQEAVSNVARHANASMVKIQVESSATSIAATIEDNGKGFDLETALQSPDSWGLRGIKERIVILGGQLSIDTGTGKGTCIRLQIPLERPADEQDSHPDSG